MPTQEAKAHRVGEWASLRNTSPEIAEAIFEVAHYDEKLAEKIWECSGSQKARTRSKKDATPCCVAFYVNYWPECSDLGYG